MPKRQLLILTWFISILSKSDRKQQVLNWGNTNIHTSHVELKWTRGAVIFPFTRVSELLQAINLKRNSLVLFTPTSRSKRSNL